MTQAIYIPPAPAIIPAATWLHPNTVASYSDIEELPYPLQAMETVMVFIDNNGNITHPQRSAGWQRGRLLLRKPAR
jgi:hypothetical protein